MHRNSPSLSLALLTSILLLAGCGGQSGDAAKEHGNGAPTMDASTEALRISDAYLRLPPPGAKVAAGYLDLHNLASQPITIDALSSPGFARVEAHEMRHADGMMQMRRLPELVIGAGQTIQLAPHGTHLMLMSPQVALEEGDQVEVRLEYRVGDTTRQQSITLPVRRP